MSDLGNPGDRFKDIYFKPAEKDIRKQTYKDVSGNLRTAAVQDLTESESLELVVRNLPSYSFAGPKTGFADFCRRQAAKGNRNGASVDVPGGMIDEQGVPQDMLEVEDARLIREARRRESGQSGFANFERMQKAKEAGDGYDFHDDQKLDNEEGGDAAGANSGGNVGFSSSEHVDAIEQNYRRDKQPYGGNAIGAEEKDGKFKKPNPLLQDDDLEDGMIREADQPLTDHLQTEEVDDRSKQDQNDRNWIPEEPADAYVPDKGKGTDGITDPLGDTEEFRFPEKGDWPLPGMSQSTQEHPTYQQINAKRIQLEDGRVYVGKVTSVKEDAIQMQGVLLGSGMKKSAAFEIDRSEIINVRPYRPKPVLKVNAEKMDDMYSGYDKTVKAKTITIEEARQRARQNKERKAEQVEEADMVENINQPGRLALVQSVEGQLATLYFGGKQPLEEIAMSELHVVEKNAAENPNILKKFFGMKDDKTKVDRKEMDEDRIAKVDHSTNDEGYLFGDDKALKDALDKHEKEASKIEAGIKVLIEKSAAWDKQGKDKEAEALLLTAEEEQKKLANVNIKIAELKKNFEVVKTAGKPGEKSIYFQTGESGEERMFE